MPRAYRVGSSNRCRTTVSAAWRWPTTPTMTRRPMMLDRTGGDDGLGEIDRDALSRSMALAERDRDRRLQLQTTMDDARPWREVAEFAAGCCQAETLRLRPW